jgi:uncharacterized membrane protein
MYELLLYLHIVSATVWVGGAVYVQVLGIRVSRSDDPADLPRFARDAEAIGRVVFAPAAFVILGTGAVMTIQAWDFGQAWIAIAIGLWVVSAVAGSAYLAPTSKRVVALYEAEGPTSVAGRRLIERMFLVSRLELVSFAVIVGLMVFKPGA